jgi:mannose-6-phosphate isomerase-like protein (cupin superfamily)
MAQFLIVVLLTAANLLGAQQPAAKPAQKAQAAGVVYIPAKQLQDSKPGTRVLDRDHFGVMFLKRDAAGEAELHENETDIFYVVDGAATFVTGGTIEGGKTTAPGEIRGADLRGGQTHHLSKGDAIVIPKQTPHRFTAVDGTMTYFVVKVRE